jgi:D-serine deaminase-like pyridoxal phosphate-dependent protein
MTGIAPAAARRGNLDSSLATLDTPQAAIDLGLVRRHIERMQQYCDAHGIALRPHVKTHKLVPIARLQLAAGAAGIACQKLGEAEVMVGAGMGDVLVTFPLVGEHKLRRLGALAARARISTVVDSEAGARGISRAAADAGVQVPLLVECDTGYARTGVQTPSEAAELAALVERLPGVAFEGLMTYPTSQRTGEFFAATRSELQRRGLEPAVVSTGGTEGAFRTHEVAEVNELRVGTYVYGDRAFVAKGSVTVQECALTVLSTVVSRPTHGRAIIDAGSKALSSDPANGLDDGEYGEVLDLPGSRLRRLSEEHGHLDVSACDREPDIGEVVRVLPNHACGTANMHDDVAVHHEGRLEAVWKLDARGAMR